MISLNPHFIANVDTANKDVIAEERRLFREENMSEKQHKKREKRHMRGRDKIGKKQNKRQQNVVDQKNFQARQHLQEEGRAGAAREGVDKGGVLDRFRIHD